MPESPRRALVVLTTVVALAGAGATSCGDDSAETVSPRDTASTTIPDEAGGSEGRTEHPDGELGDTAVCSAAELEGITLSQSPDLPPAVATVRQDIVDAAVHCRYEQLATIALTDEFTYSFGAEDDPAGYWRQLEEQGERPLETLVRLLDGAHATTESEDRTIFVWPPEAVEQDQYLDYRVGIDDGGDWLYFVAGD